MGNATSMFNLMRNLGGGIGIAAATTFLFRRQQFHTARLTEHVDVLNVQAHQWLSSAQQAMVARGVDPSSATGASFGALWGTVLKQASMMAFIDTFRVMGIVFLCVLPFLLLMKKPKHHRSAGPMH
jgi:DHA2 family multidrug resistance protein